MGEGRNLKKVYGGVFLLVEGGVNVRRGVCGFCEEKEDGLCRCVLDGLC